MKNIKKKIQKKLKTTVGFSVMELLLCVMILLLVSQTMALGISFASKNFKKQMRDSEAQILFTTLQETIDGELMSTFGETIYDTSSGNKYHIVSFYSPSFMVDSDEKLLTSFCTVDEDGNPVSDGGGYVAIGEATGTTFTGMTIVSGGLYTYGTTAKAENLYYYTATSTVPAHFTYDLTVYGQTEISEKICVFPTDADAIELTAK